jgi:lysophospholipid acyltransferase (LPLAT)-like uncharacterized protein
VLLAAKTGAALLPFSISLDRCWRLPSWDGIQIPKPFARAVVVIGERLYVREELNETDLKHQHLQRALEELRERSDQAVDSA